MSYLGANQVHCTRTESHKFIDVNIKRHVAQCILYIAINLLSTFEISSWESPISNTIDMRTDSTAQHAVLAASTRPHP